MSLALIYWFSGSGNARRLAETVGNTLRDEGVEARLVPIEGGLLDPAHDEANLIGVVSAVYGFGLPERVGAFLLKMPAGIGQRAFVLTAIGNEETVELGPLHFTVPPTEGIANLDAEGRLARLGYEVVRSDTIRMPNSWFLPCDPPDKATCEGLLSAAEASARLFTTELLAGARRRADFRLLPHLALGMVHLLYLAVGRRLFGKYFVATSACTSCGRCARECPAGVICMVDGRPHWSFDCQGCFRCANLCPTAAIEVSGTVLFGGLAFTLFGARLLRLILGGNRSRTLLGLLTLVAILPFHALLHHAVNGRGLSPLPAWPLTASRRRYTQGLKDEREEEGPGRRQE